MFLSHPAKFLTAICLAVATAGCFNTGPKLGSVENTVTNQAAELAQLQHSCHEVPN